MPTLRKYKPSSEKSGYYIQANPGGLHPITLQVTKVAETILRQTGYQPDQSVPTKLVWAMYDLDLLYTKKSIDPDDIKEASTEEVLRELNLGNRLSSNERKELLSCIEKYKGPQKKTLERLKKELETTSISEDSDITNSNRGHSSDTEEPPETEIEAVSYLFQMTSGVEGFRQAKNHVDTQYLLRSLQTFIPHPYTDYTEAKIDDSWNIRYPLYPPNYEQTFWLTDHRKPRDYPGGQDADYVLCVPEKEGTTEAVIVDDEVVDFTPDNSGEYGDQQLMEDLEWIIPPSPVAMDKLDGPIITGWKHEEVEPIRCVRNIELEDFQIVEVDYINNNGNPVIRIDGEEHLLDRGKPGEEYVAKDTGRKFWKAFSKVID